MLEAYDWGAADRFVNREEDLKRLEVWWESSTKDVVAVVGRRRVGKSWLLHRFAHEKPSLILVADELLATTQMARFATQLEPVLGVMPSINGVADLVRILLRAGQERKLLAVIDEFPLLLPDGQARRKALTEVQAALDELRDKSQTKLVFCGSLVAQMEGLTHTDSPLHGRIQRLDVLPLTFAESRTMIDPKDSATERITRYSVAGGMTRYLSELGMGSLKTAVCDRVLNRNGPLFDDPRSVLEQELREPATYLSILGELALHAVSTEHLSKALGVSSAKLAPYLRRLSEMRLVDSAGPIGSSASGRKTKHRLSDGFVRFWFRFVLPYQDSLQTGLHPKDLWKAQVEPNLADFTSPAFEEICARYIRGIYGSEAPTVGSWWGNSLNRFRRSGQRRSEEIDVVAAQNKTVKIVAECKWTSQEMPLKVLKDLRDFKLPALAQEGVLRLPADGPLTILFSRSGFSDQLAEAAKNDAQLILIEPDELVESLYALPS